MIPSYRDKMMRKYVVKMMMTMPNSPHLVTIPRSFALPFLSK